MFQKNEHPVVFAVTWLVVIRF